MCPILANSVELIHLDLRDLDLVALAQEPRVPAHIKKVPDDYAHTVTREWSAKVSASAAFVIVTPQYNWGYPAPLKQALDSLYWEWRNKPVAVVSYGGRGGGKCNAQLREVLSGLRMQVVGAPEVAGAGRSGGVELAFPSEVVRDMAMAGEDIGVELGKGGGESEAYGVWASQRDAVGAAFRELIGILDSRQEGSHV